ncbi:polysaccharide deacetylase [Psychromonas sp. MB-3u-54]|uniref:polysaccharide deacetylase family protein n=1 Tax=Psychromonas sp. MB-3u-54 TaxID=2058319 RepID=UPI000C33C3D2|nr:polysaccharide deacetylase family protein [Psychromonas sp. MB-3u-54]PKH01069.1 polysaccharide deacetylase [Psychromonas sp. MB-3u-54]
MAFFKKGYNYLFKKLFLLGLGRLVRRLFQHKITIVSMHGVMFDHENVLWQPLREQLKPEVLERTIRILSEHYTFISLGHAKNILSGVLPSVKNGLVFTLDDGYWNNLTYAGEVFNKYDIKPTIFISTKNIDQCSPFWFDRLDYALQQLTEDRFFILFGSEKFTFNTSSRAKLKQSYAKFRSKCKAFYLTDIEMRDALDRISSQIETETSKALTDIIKVDDWTRLASWSELIEVSNSDKFDVGSHTVDHIRIALTDHITAREQLVASKEKIELHLDKACKYFCYPNGNVDDVVSKMVADAGYELAVTTKKGLNSPGDDMMKLRRFSIPIQEKSNDVLYAISPLRI